MLLMFGINGHWAVRVFSRVTTAVTREVFINLYYMVNKVSQVNKKLYCLKLTEYFTEIVKKVYKMAKRRNIYPINVITYLSI